MEEKVGENKQNGEETATRRNAEAGFVTGLRRVEIKALQRPAPD